MKLNPKTVSILKNFSTINPSILIKPGSTLKTISPTKTVMAMAEIPDTFDNMFAIYNLSQFLACISMFNNPELEFSSSSVSVSDGNRSIVYHYADPSVVLAPPDKDIVLPSKDAKFRLENKDIQDVTKALGILGLPELAVTGDGTNIILQAVDSKNQSTNHYSIIVGETSKVFRAIFKAENLKMTAGDYDVTLSSKGISYFQGIEASYYIAIEASSTF